MEAAVADEMDDRLYWQSIQHRSETRRKYKLEDYGLDAKAVNAAFSRYREFVTASGIREPGK